MHEPDVIRVIKRYLTQHGLAGHSVAELYTDAHPTLVGYRDLKPFQRFTLPLDGMHVYPDLVGRLDDGETMFAIEAKGSNGNALQGVMQAASYRAGFHRSLLALPNEPHGEVRSLAHQLHVGLLVAQGNTGLILDVPAAHLPRYEPAMAIRRQFTATALLSIGFSLNMPTHYLSIPVAVRDAVAADDDFKQRLETDYTVLPRGQLKAAIRGALKLGVVIRRGDDIGLSVVGEAAARLLPALPSLAEIHRAVTAQRTATIDQVHPLTGAVLRWLLSSDPIVMLILSALNDLGGGPHSMLTLARAMLARDRAVAVVALFLPEVLADILDGQGQVRWNRVTPAHFRGTLRYQYKSLMRQAGLIVPHPLGQSQPAHYDPQHDLWELFARSPFVYPD